MAETFMETLAEILQKDKSALTEADLAYLRARSSYLSPEQLEAYGLAEQTAKPSRKAKATEDEE